MKRILFALAALCLALVPYQAIAAGAGKPAAKLAVAVALSPKPLGTAKGWMAYSAGEKNSLVCYLFGHPAKSLPANPKRKPADAHVTHRPADKALNVVNFDLGYDAKPGSSAELDIDGKKFTLFTNKDSAWANDAAEDKAVTIALAKGKRATLKATPELGAATTDIYSLDGFGEALALIDKACNVKR